MFITQKTVYVVGDKSFASLAQAEDHIQNCVLTRLQSALIPNDPALKYSSVIKFADFLINNRQEFADLLGYELPETDDDV